MMEKFTVYITKYALSQGIIEVEAEECGCGMICVKGIGCFF